MELKRYYYKLYSIAATAPPLLLLFMARLLEPFLEGLPMLVYSLLISVLLLCYCTILILILFKVVCVKRLNDYFIELKYPWCSWRFVMQCINKKHTRGMTCRQMASDFSKQEAEAFAAFKPKRVYIADTHETIIRRLKRNPHIKIIKQELSRQISMKSTQKNFLGKKCETSCSSEKQKACIVRKGLAEKRNMYFLRFEYI